MRIAFVSPLPPAPTGIADYSADVVTLLAPDHEVDLFHAREAVDRARLPASCAVHRASELAGRNRERPYDAVVHHMGNGVEHAFVYDLLPRAPGLLVLHDLVLFHSRAAAFLDSEPVRAWRRDPASAAAREAARPAFEAWREELSYSYPAQGSRLYEAHLGTVGDLLPYAYPLFRLPVEASRAVAVHSAYAAEAVREEVAGAPVVELPMPVAAAAVDPGAVRSLRERIGLSSGDVVVGAFGLMTREKRIDSILRAVARAAAADPRLRLLLVGPMLDERRLQAAIEAHGLRSRTILTGRVPFEQLPLHMEAADLIVHLRHPTGRETSAALLRVLAQARPAIVSDLAHQAELPEAAVRRVDLAEEDEELPRAILELAADAPLRRGLGEAAADHVRRAHGREAVVAAWERALRLTSGLPDPAPRAWPGHWRRP